MDNLLATLPDVADVRTTPIPERARSTRMMWWTTPAPGITQQWGVIE